MIRRKADSAVALAESCVTGKVGAMISLMDEMDPAPLIFSETQSRILVTIAPESLFLIESLSSKYRTPIEVIGKVGGSGLIIKKGKRTFIDLPVSSMSGAYYDSIEKAVEVR